MEIVWMLAVGLISGALAKLLTREGDSGGIVITMIVGVAGSVVAGCFARVLGWYDAGNLAGMVASLVGAVVLLFLYHVLTAKTHWPF